MQNRFEAFRSRGPWQLFVDSLLLMMRHAGSLLSTVGLLAGPVLFISSLAFGWFLEPFTEVETAEELREALAGVAGHPSYFIVILTALLAQLMLFAGVSVWVVLYVETDMPPALGRVWDRLITEFGVLAATGAGVLVLFMALSSLLLLPVLGIPLFVLAAIYYAVTLSPVGMVRLWERLGLLRSVLRCRALVRFGFAGTLGVLMLTTLVYFAGIVALGMVLPVVLAGLPDSGPLKDVAGAFFSTLGSLWFSTVLLGANLNYFNLVTRERSVEGKSNTAVDVENDDVESVR